MSNNTLGHLDYLNIFMEALVILKRLKN